MVYLVSIPFLFVSLLKSRYKYSIFHRFFLRDFPLHLTPNFWFHACSYGEIKSLEPILNTLLKNNPNKFFLITVITQTGYELAKMTYIKQVNVEVKFLPFEIFIPFWHSKLKSLQTLIITEAELWYAPLKLAKNIGAKTMLINARISPNSFPKYQKTVWFYRKIFAQIDKIFAQTNVDVSRLASLGAKSLVAFGNLKIFCTPQVTVSYPKSSKLTFIGASTHYGEEELILKAFLSLRNEDKFLILVPRHPERFKEVERLAKKLLSNSPHTLKIFSKNGFCNDCSILLVDALGELNNLYAISDVVILGGAFAKIGGHNPLEPAFFGTKLISGHHIFNQTALFEAIEGFKIIQANELPTILAEVETLPNTSIKNRNDKISSLIACITEKG